MKKTLVILAHPNIEESRVNSTLINHLKNQKAITVHELYKKYPDFKINVQEEQDLLLTHDNVVWQFPLHWYTVPSLLKEWMDKVFTYGFSHGIGGDKLKGKKLLIAISTAMSKKHYHPSMFLTHENIEPIEDIPSQPYLKPDLAKKYDNNIMEIILSHLEQAVYHTSMIFQKPLVTHSSIPLQRAPHAISNENLKKQAEIYLETIKEM